MYVFVYGQTHRKVGNVNDTRLAPLLYLGDDLEVAVMTPSANADPSSTPPLLMIRRTGSTEPLVVITFALGVDPEVAKYAAHTLLEGVARFEAAAFDHFKTKSLE